VAESEKRENFGFKTLITLKL